MPLFGRKQQVAPTIEQPDPPTLPDPPSPRPDGLRGVTDHRDYVLSCVESLPAFGQQLMDAVGLSLCQDVASATHLPRYDNAGVHGYAVRAGDVEAASEPASISLPVVGEIAAGDVVCEPLAPGTAMKIAPGALIPGGADAVVPDEATDRGDRDVKIIEPSEHGENIRQRGEDVTEGATVLHTGQRLSPRSVGLLAGIGVNKVLVRPTPRVVVISTDSDLVEPGLTLEREQQAFDANSYLMAAAARAAGAQVFRIRRVPDDAEQLRQVISDQLIRADLILMADGVSPADDALVRQVVSELGPTDFSRVAMRPGKPHGFGLIGEDPTPVMIVPSPPVSAFAAFEVFVRPVLRKLSGTEPFVRSTVRCVAEQPMTSVPDELELARGLMTTNEAGQRQIRLAGAAGAHRLAGLAAADALVLIDPETDFVAAGDEVAVWPLDDGSG